MKDIIKKVFLILNSKEKKILYLLIPLTLIMFFIEILSLGFILPITTLIVSKENLSEFFKFDNDTLNNLLFWLDSFQKNELLIYFLIIYLIIFLFKNLYILFYNWYIFTFSNLIQFRISKEFLINYLRFDYEKITNLNSSVFLNNIIGETNQIRNVVRYFVMFVSEFLIVIGILGMIFLYDFTSSSTAAIILFISVLFYYHFIKKLSVNLGYKRHKLNKVIIKNILQSYSGFKIVKIHNKENLFLDLHDVKFKKFLNLNKILSLLDVLPRLWIEFFALLSISTFIFFLTKKIGNLEEMIPFLSLIAVSTVRIVPSISKIMISMQSFKQITVSVNLVFDNLIRNKVLKKNNNFEFNSFNSEIILKDIDFKFPSRTENVLKNLNCNIKKGQIIALVGKSGSGKSTLVNILLGVLKPNLGKIYIDGSEVDLYDQKNWMRKIGYVSQDTFLLDESIIQNVSLEYDKKNIDYENVSKVINEVELNNFVNSLPNKLNTIVGENGLKISGGQKQRLGIARALYVDPEILIFDEPTSSLDEKNSKQIYELLLKLKSKKTVIVVSHNLYYKEMFDKIFELKNGKLIVK